MDSLTTAAPLDGAYGGEGERKRYRHFADTAVAVREEKLHLRHTSNAATGGIEIKQRQYVEMQRGTPERTGEVPMPLDALPLFPTYGVDSD